METRRVLQRVERPAFVRHGVGDIVDVERGGCERHDADEWVAEDGEVGVEGGGVADGGFESFGGADDGMAGGNVAAFALRHETCPAGCDEGAWAGAGDAGGGVHAAGPVG